MKETKTVILFLLLGFAMLLFLNSCSNYISNSINRKCERIEKIVTKKIDKNEFTIDQKKALLSKIKTLKELSLNTDPYYAKIINVELKKIKKDLKKNDLLNRDVYSILDSLEIKITKVKIIKSP